MAQLPKVVYPNELTPAYWDKKKPVLAKSKKTGIGEALTSLKKAHDAIIWTNFEPQPTTVHIDEKLQLWPKMFKDDVKPISDMAKDVQKLAKKWSGEFTKDKLIPKSATAAADAVADAAKKYSDTLLDYEGTVANYLVAHRKEIVASYSKVLKPMFTKTLNKINGLIKDLGNYGRNPTKENYWSIFSGDCNARGYTTGCKNWDQVLIEFPDLRDQCYKGKAMDDFFPGMKDYGAEWDEMEFDKRINSKLRPGTDVWRHHAVLMLKQGPNIKKFKAAIEKLLKLLEAK